MEHPQQIHRVFRCPRCQHTEPETVPHRTYCPRCGLILPRPEREYLVGCRRHRLALRQMSEL